MKSTGCAVLARAPAAIALGGLPIIVPIPPVVAAIGTPRRNALRAVELLPILPISGITAAITIAVVAVFDMSIEKSMVISINPNKTHFGFVPHTFSVN